MTTLEKLQAIGKLSADKNPNTKDLQAIWKAFPDERSEMLRLAFVDISSGLGILAAIEALDEQIIDAALEMAQKLFGASDKEGADDN